MILQELVNYYDRKVAAGGGIAPEGWASRPVDYFLVLDRQGECVGLEANYRLEKSKLIARSEMVPAIGKQSLKHTNSGKDANLLWDNASFFFGLGNRGSQKFDSFRATIDDWLGQCNDEGVDAVKRFLQKVASDPSLTNNLIEQFGYSQDFAKRDPVLAFRWQPDNGIPIFHRPSVKEAYEHHRSGTTNPLRGNCLITGEIDVPIAQNETVIKGIWDAQTSGANIVSFNARSFESYGKRERNGENAPIGERASFAYTTALNQLLEKSSRQRIQIGDTSTVFWAEKTDDFETLVPDLFGEPPKDDPDRGIRALETLYRSVQSGSFLTDNDPTRCHVLGLAPNAARISVRFWQTGTAAELGARLRRHFDDLEVARSPNDPRYLSLFRLLAAVAVQGKADNIPPNLGGEIVRAVLAGEDAPYPVVLLNAAVARCRAEQQVTYPRAAAIKATLNRTIRRHNNIAANPEKEFTSMLDTANQSPAYRLGRLFATLEKIQEEASPGLNATIRDRYYGAASSTPVAVFTTLLRLKNHHIGKLSPGRRVNLERLIGEIMDGLTDFPRQLPLPEQGRFALGYYHQRQDFFTRKPDSNNPNTSEEQ